VAQRHDSIRRGRGDVKTPLNASRRARGLGTVQRRRSAFLSLGFGYTTLFVALARNIIFVPIYLRTIPLAEYGAWLATGGALALILINDYGLSGVVTQRISTNFGAGQFDRLGGLAGSAIAIGAVTSLLLTLISLALVPYVPGLAGLSPIQAVTVVACFKISIAANALGVIGATAASVIRSMQSAALAGSIVLAADIANIVVTLYGLFAGNGLYAIAVGLLARSLIVTIASLSGVWVLCARELGSRLTVVGSVIRNLLGESSRFFLSAIAMKLQAQANVFFVGASLGPTSAAVYGLTVRAHETVLMLIAQINGALVPSITHLVGSGDRERFRAVLFRVLVLIGTLAAFALTLTVILNAGFIRLWVGQYAFGGESVSVLMAVALFVSSISYVAYDGLLAQGKFRVISRSFTATSLLQVFLLMAFVHWGLWFAPLTTLITACIWGSVFWNSIIIDHGVRSAEIRQLAKEFVRIILFSVAAAAALMTLYPNANSWFALVVEGLFSSACLAGGYLVISPAIRAIASEEIRTTLDLFRAA
jgi:O-antigen/teichoic acid export membrane protein